MRRSRRPFMFLSALSLMLCAAIVVLWLRSFRVGDSFALYWNGRSDQVPWQRQTVGAWLDVVHFDGRLGLLYTGVAILPDKHGWRYKRHERGALKVLRLGMGSTGEFRSRSRGAMGFRWFAYLASTAPRRHEYFL